MTTFEIAVNNSKNLSQKPENDELLKLYALYKQATEGDISGERPTGFDFKGIAKYDAWDAMKGMSQEAAKEAYIAFVKELQNKYA